MTALFVARPLFPSESAANYGDGLAMVMLWIALATFWLLGVLGHAKFELRFGWTDVAAVVLVGWYVVSGIGAVMHGTPRPAMNMLWEWIGLGLSFFMVRQLVRTAQETRAVVAVMIGAALALSVYGLYQRFYELPATHAQYLADPDQAMRDAGLWFPPGSPERALFEARMENREPLATFALTNSLAAFLAPWLVLLLAIGGSNRRIGKQVHFLLCSMPILLCLAFTKSRSGYIAVVFGWLLYWLASRRKNFRIGWKIPTAAAAVLVLAIGLAVSGHDFGLLGKATRSFGYRIQYWQSSLQMIAHHPWLGCGPGNFQNAYPQFKLPEASEEIADPHNFLLEIWSNAGTPAMLAFVVMLGCFFRGQRSGDGGQGEDELPSPFGRVSRGDGGVNLPSPACGRGAGGEGGSYRQEISQPIPILLGGILGFALAIPIGMLSAAPPGLFVTFLGLPFAIVAFWLLYPWIQNGELPSWAPAIGVAVLLVDLLAAGGIGLPSVAGTFWLLLALGLHGKPVRSLQPSVAWAALVIAVGLAIACYRTAYEPVLNCQGQMRLAQHRLSQAEQYLEAAAAADPLSAEPWRQMAALAFEQWWQTPDQELFERFERADAKVLELSPNAAPAWYASGSYYLRATTKPGPDVKRQAPNAASKSIEALAKAIAIYPNNATYHATLAEACNVAGDRARFRVEAETALQLDEATPHIDKKLPAEVRDRLRRQLSEHSPKR
jgi:O-antigen ligase